jgi:hypothetical protein
MWFGGPSFRWIENYTLQHLFTLKM